MEKFKNREEYETILEKRSMLPKGFKTSVVPFRFYPEEKVLEEPLPMNLSLILMDEKTRDFAGVFTKNLFPGHPVIHGRKMLESEFCQGIIINNKISNVRCKGGLETIENILDKLGKELELDKELFFSSSTGIIGWKLPEKDIIDHLPDLKNQLNDNSILGLSKAIMTTDNFPKVRRADLGGGSIVAIAKGAGMIEPNMATMLLFILTDIKVNREDLRPMLQRVMNRTFNRISIDSDQSTSDTGIILSSGLVDDVEISDFENELEKVCRDLCQDVVRNGEGTAHVIEVKVNGAESESDALTIGKGIINSPLFKSAIYGNDPNLGRLLQAIGDVSGNNGIELEPDLVTLTIGGETVYDKGSFCMNDDLEQKLSRYLNECSFSATPVGYPEHDNNVKVVVDLHRGEHDVIVYGSDLSYEYVRENADYRS